MALRQKRFSSRPEEKPIKILPKCQWSTSRYAELYPANGKVGGGERSGSVQCHQLQ